MFQVIFNFMCTETPRQANSLVSKNQYSTAQDKLQNNVFQCNLVCMFLLFISLR